MDKVYIAGPMRGLPYFNYPAFAEAEKRLTEQGWGVVFNPARHDAEVYGQEMFAMNPAGDLDLAEKEHAYDLGDSLSDDITWICQEADAVYMLDGWERSKGATAERAVALALGTDVLYQTKPRVRAQANVLWNILGLVVAASVGSIYGALGYESALAGALTVLAVWTVTDLAVRLWRAFRPGRS
jgi:hypothetical protein